MHFRAPRISQGLALRKFANLASTFKNPGPLSKSARPLWKAAWILRRLKDRVTKQLFGVSWNFAVSDGGQRNTLCCAAWDAGMSFQWVIRELATVWRAGFACGSHWTPYVHSTFLPDGRPMAA